MRSNGNYKKVRIVERYVKRRILSYPLTIHLLLKCIKDYSVFKILMYTKKEESVVKAPN